MNHKTYSIWCSKQGLNPYLKSSQDKWEEIHNLKLEPSITMEEVLLNYKRIYKRWSKGIGRHRT